MGKEKPNAEDSGIEVMGDEYTDSEPDDGDTYTEDNGARNTEGEDADDGR